MVQKIVKQIHDIKANPRSAWEHINMLKGGKHAHHKSKTNMPMRMANGKLQWMPKRILEYSSHNFSKLLNSERAINKSVLNLIQQWHKLRGIDTHITFTEVNKAISRLNRGKAPGLNGVPLEALKTMNPIMRREIHGLVSDLFEVKADYKSWHKSRCVTVPKTGDLANSNKWRGIMLMDICSKILSSLMTTRVFKLLKKYGTIF